MDTGISRLQMECVNCMYITVSFGRSDRKAQKSIWTTKVEEMMRWWKCRQRGEVRYGRTTNSYCVKCGWIDGYAKGYLYLRIRDIWKGRRPLTVLGVKRCIEEGECGKEIRRVLGCDKCRKSSRWWGGVIRSNGMYVGYGSYRYRHFTFTDGTRQLYVNNGIFWTHRTIVRKTQKSMNLRRLRWWK